MREGLSSRVGYVRTLRGLAIQALGGRCEKENCGSTDRLLIHHRDRNPRNNEVNNLQVLCVKHHGELGYATGGAKEEELDDFTLPRVVAIRAIQENGRVSIPSKTLKHLGWKKGDYMSIFEDVEDGQVIIRKGE